MKSIACALVVAACLIADANITTKYVQHDNDSFYGGLFCLFGIALVVTLFI